MRPNPLRIVPLLLVAAALPGCSSKQRLHEYDYRNRTLAITTIAPARAEVFSSLRVDIDETRPIETIIRTSGNVAREAAALKIRARVDSAGRRFSVADRMGGRLLQGAARHLRTTPVADARRADYELELVVTSYGLTASSWSSQAYFRITADVRLLDGATGRRIWKTDVIATDAVDPVIFGREGRTISGAVTAIALANLSSAEIQRALESLTDFAADFLVNELAESLDDARG